MESKELTANEWKIEQFTLDLRNNEPYTEIKGVSEKTVVIEGTVSDIWISVGSYGVSIAMKEEREFFNNTFDAAEFCCRVLKYFKNGGARVRIAEMRAKYESDKKKLEN